MAAAAPVTTWFAPVIEAEAFGRRWPCRLVYAVDVDDPPDLEFAWQFYDDARGDFLVGLDWKGGSLGLNVPVTIRYAGVRERQDGEGAELMVLTFGSLFACIGGMDLGLERAGLRCIWQVEIDDYCRRVLAKHWPNLPRHDDVKTFTGDGFERPDVICGGFPCQPVSTAGKRLGQKDPRWLWPEFARVVRVFQPRYVLIENTPGLFVRGFADVLGDLAALGFDAEWSVIPAAAFGAPHVRDRIFVVAYAAGERVRPVATRPCANTARQRCAKVRQQHGRTTGRPDATERDRPTADADMQGPGRRQRCPAAAPQLPLDSDGPRLSPPEQTRRNEPQEAAGILRGPVAECDWWAVEPDVVRMVHGLPGRVDRVRALGNAVVPQVAEWIGRRLMECES